MGRHRGGIDYVNNVLGMLKGIDDSVHDKKQTLNEFLEELRIEMQSSGCSLLENAHFLYVGSSYEGSAVHKMTDFDIPLILSRPFTADNFELIERHEPGFYKLRPDNDDVDKAEYGQWLNRNHFLKIQDLKDYIFDELSEVLDRIKGMNPCWSLKYRKQVCSYKVTIKDLDGDSMKIDLVPALRGIKFENIPGGRQCADFPELLQNRGQYDYYLTLGAAPHLKNKNDSHLLVTIAFGELEKVCLKNSVTVLNAVRLTKLVGNAMGWKNFGFRGFHIKRIAIKYFADLAWMSNWDAYVQLLWYLLGDLQECKIDGYFLYNQNIYDKDDDTVEKLRQSITYARDNVKPHNLPSFIQG